MPFLSPACDRRIPEINFSSVYRGVPVDFYRVFPATSPLLVLNKNSIGESRRLRDVEQRRRYIYRTFARETRVGRRRHVT